MYVDFKLTMMDILSGTEIVSSSGISVPDDSATSEDGLEPVADDSGSEVVSEEIISDANISEETLVNDSDNSMEKTLEHIDSTLTIILIVILLVWVSNHLHIVAKTFGKIGKGE